MMRDKGVVSYTWMLQMLKDYLRGIQTLKVIVIDRDERLSSAISDIFQVIF